MNTELGRAVKRGVNFRVDVEALAKGNVDISHVRDVSLSLRNSRVYELLDVDVAERANKLDTRCLRALQRRARANFKTSIVSAAFVSDLQYHVRWEDSADLSVQAKIAELEALSAQLGLTSSTVTDKTISAEGLVLGVRLDSYLAYLYSPEHVAKEDRRESISPDTWDGRIIDKDDSAVSTSSGEMPTLSSSRDEDAYWQQIDVTQE